MTIQLKTFQRSLTGTQAYALVLLKKHAPHILFGGGIITGLAGTVAACKATLKATEVLESHQETMAYRLRAYEETDEKDYNDENLRNDQIKVIMTTTWSLTQLYAPALLLGLTSISMLTKSHGMLTSRGVAMAAAYKAIDESFRAYRRRVVDEFGPETDEYIRHRKQADKPLKIVSKDGGKKVDLSAVEAALEEGEMPSMYAKFYDPSSTQWRQDPSQNIFFLKTQQNYANDMMQARGHVFLNEVYDMLGLPRTKAGAVVGWVKNHGDDFIDFGLFNGEIDVNRDVVNGYENQAILLDFNVAGMIYDML